MHGLLRADLSKIPLLDVGQPRDHISSINLVEVVVFNSKFE